MKQTLQLLLALAMFFATGCDDFSQPVDLNDDGYFRSPAEGTRGLEATVLVNGWENSLNSYGDQGWQCTGGWYSSSSGPNWACYRGHAGSATFTYWLPSWSKSQYPNGPDEAKIEDIMDSGWSPMGCIDAVTHWVCGMAKKDGSSYVPGTVFASASTESQLNYHGDNGVLLHAAWKRGSTERWGGFQWYNTTFDYDLYSWWVPSPTHIAWKWTHEGRALFGCYPRGGSRYDCAFVRAD